MLGVALGFLVNEWRQGRADRALGEAALRSIAAEMSQNCVQLREVQPYYARVGAALDSLATADGVARINRVPGFRGMNPPLLRTGSYEVALATGALAHVPFETADLASQVYAVQDYVRRTVEYGLQGLISGATPEDGVGVRMTFQLLDETARSTLYYYDALEGSVFSDRGFRCPTSEGT